MGDHQTHHDHQVPAGAPELDAVLAQAGEIAMRYFRTSPEELGQNDKGSAHGFDPVTIADKSIEKYLRSVLRERFPDDQIVGEEFGSDGPSDASRTWFIDPIDGTKSYVSGMAGWGVLVGLVEDGVAVHGCLHQPFLGETFTGSVAAGAASASAVVTDRSGITRRLHTSSTTALADAVMYTTHPTMFDAPQLSAGFATLCDSVRLQRYGGDCYAYAMLAAGHVDLVVEAELNAYDIVALIPLVQAAGGVVLGEDGRPPLNGGTVVAAATEELAKAAWALLR